jgi:hypothetical protein
MTILLVIGAAMGLSVEGAAEDERTTWSGMDENVYIYQLGFLIDGRIMCM